MTNQNKLIPLLACIVIVLLAAIFGYGVICGLIELMGIQG